MFNQYRKLFGLGVAVALLAFGAGNSSLGTLAAVVQPPPGQGSVYLTKAVAAPDGAVVKPLDLKLGLFQTVVRALGSPENILCGPDGRLYVNDLFQREASGIRVNRILRFKQDGSGRTFVADWDAAELWPSAMVFAPNGDLYFGTVSTEPGKPTKGIWRIPGALQAGQEFNAPQQVLQPNVFTPPPSDKIGASTGPFAFLTAEPFAGDLLIIDDPRTFSVEGAGSERPGSRVLRALKPDFNTVVEFIPFQKDPETGEPFSAASLTIANQGDVLVNDFDNNKVLRYGPDGMFKGVFAQVETPNQIAIGPDGLVYVTNVSFLPGGAVRGGLFIFDPEGKEVVSANFSLFLRGVTVCAPQ